MSVFYYPLRKGFSVPAQLLPNRIVHRFAEAYPDLQKSLGLQNYKFKTISVDGGLKQSETSSPMLYFAQDMAVAIRKKWQLPWKPSKKIIVSIKESGNSMDSVSYTNNFKEALAEFIKPAKTVSIIEAAPVLRRESAYLIRG